MTDRLARTAAFLLAAAAIGACTAHRQRAPETADAKLVRAYDLIQRGYDTQALREFSEILFSDPANHQVRLELGYLHMRLQHWKEAVRYLGSALDEDPGNVRLRMELGYARQGLGDLDAAADDFRIVLRTPNEFQEQAGAALQSVLSISADAPRKVEGDTLLNDGYDALKRGKRSLAKERFQRALKGGPDRAEVHKQLGYMSVQEGNVDSAIKSFEGARRLQPTDFLTSLELGYMYDSMRNERSAMRSFNAALASPDPEVRESARAAVENIRSRHSRVFLDIYGSPYYTSRFSNRIAYAEAQFGYRLPHDSPVSVYLGTRYAQDSKSHAGTEPQVLSDNALSLGPGIRLQPEGFNASLTAEYNKVFNLTRTPEHDSASEWNPQVQLADYHYWNKHYGPIGWLTLGEVFPERAFSDLGFNVGYYARYRDNVIGLVQYREGFKLVDTARTLVSAYVPVNVMKDVNRDFFNNLIELGAGIELHPILRYSVKLRAEFYRGVYLGIEGRDPNPYGANYNDFRLSLLFTKRFSIQGPPAERASKPGYEEETGGRPFRWHGYLW
ncbi:MAG: tetratricopeptide repeat protein [Elusimicrobia bacterium]|nr:tetratricopeptide repeat protein [Elusimicrobiota bacterium]